MVYITTYFIGRIASLYIFSLKAEGFGDGECRRSHPQAFDKLRWGAALEAATALSY